EIQLRSHARSHAHRDRRALVEAASPREFRRDDRARMKIPSTLADTLKPDVLAELEKKLAPPPELRAQAHVEFEIEAAGEGTFTVVVERGSIAAKKGFAKDPLIAASIPKGGWALLQRELQAVVDGLPNAPALAQKLDLLRAP